MQVIERALEPNAPTGVFNVADSDAERLGVLLRALLFAFGLPPEVLYLPRGAAWPIAWILESAFAAAHASRPPLLSRYVVSQLASEFVLDIRRAERVLGYEPTRSYRDAFPEVARAAATYAATKLA